MRRWTLLTIVAALCLCHGNADHSLAGKTLTSDDPGSKVVHLDPALKKLSELIGGTWTNSPVAKGVPVVENRYEWAFNKTVIRAHRLVNKGTPQETEGEVLIGWDAVNKQVYYLDFHGGSTVFKGTVKLKDETLEFEFDTIIGNPSRWRAVDTMPDKDTLRMVISMDRNGSWVEVHKNELKRKQ